MTIDEIIKSLESYSNLHRLYDWENPEFYISSIKYDEDEDKLYIYFKEEKEKEEF
ncbi:hypothetical protein [Alkaliphilus oremlandii]|uniref:Uncharacterized protein n=1 Tax=Alkaliphilus oremlandii (strain OhILAs) TaxID=350688 RepID=A8MGA9_ALKOO|nr:hypothetical protein [Alkaliphilus oremlandii]ABW18837.1 hypothetical protein Clos_1292 [Alkaliphilus oremlandii OhILAs]